MSLPEEFAGCVYMTQDAALRLLAPASKISYEWTVRHLKKVSEEN
jgi:hypothetical protein